MAEEHRIPPRELRVRDPATGELRWSRPSILQILTMRLTFIRVGNVRSAAEVGAVDESVYPTKIGVMGHYGVMVDWSDGRTGDIYSFDVVRGLVDELAASGRV